MFAFPSYGIARSITEHNSKLEVFCDWLEGSIIFNEKEVSRSDVVDIMMEDGLYNNQDFANEWVENIWSEFKRRQACLGTGTPFKLEAEKISRETPWEQAPAHGFCLVLSLAQYFSGLHGKWRSKFKKGYNEQGELFELLTLESLQNQFNDWSLYRTGWSKSNASKLDSIVDEIAQRLGETKGDIRRWTSPDSNDEGCDLLFYRAFADSRVGVPVYLIQCASGGDWEDKLKTPDMDVWTTIIQFAAPPRKAFSTPISFTDSDFIRYTKKVAGLLLDRYRLLIPVSHKQDWLSADLAKRILEWIGPRLNTFPTI